MTVIYLDHNGTSPPTPEHMQNLCERLLGCAGNPSSPHAKGRDASVALTSARRSVAKALGVEPGHLIFTSGATEANNLATLGVVRQAGPGGHAITSAFEHPSVLEPLQYLQKNEGLELSLVAPDPCGFVSIAEIIKTITENTVLITLMAANNEVGSVQNVRLLGDFLNYARWGIKSSLHKEEELLELEKHLSPNVTKERLQKIHFHVDAVQSFGKIPVSDWFSSGIDSCSVSGHKLGALQGIGALFLRQGRKFTPLFLGGAQEKNRRAGTENLPGIVSFGLVCEKINTLEWLDKIQHMRSLRLALYDALLQLKDVSINSPRDKVIPNTVNFSITSPVENLKSRRKNGEDILLELDLHGICSSSGSACSSGANLPSKVLLAMGKTAEAAKNAIRFSLNINTTHNDIQAVIACLKKLLN